MPRQLLEVSIRTEADFSESELEILKAEAKHLSHVDDFDEEGFWIAHQKYEYKLLTIDLYEVGTFNEYDKEHTIVRTTADYTFMVRMQYPLFKKVFEAISGFQIKTTADYKIQN